MNNKARKLLVVLACTFLAFSLIGCSLVGGRGGQGDSGNVAGPAENQGGTISGRVSRDGTVGYLALRLTSGNSIQAAVRADTQFDVEGAEVWLDGIKDGDKKKVLTDVFGKFTITGVPFGKPFRLLASMLPSAADPITGKKIPFMRHSDEIKLTFEEPTKTAPTIVLSLKDKAEEHKVSHTFKDKDGNFLIGIQVTILGVTYLTNDKGTVSFTMFFPGDDRYVEFVGEEPVGFKAPEDFDPIVKGEFEIKGKTTVPASADANDPPGGIVFKVDAGTGELLSSATLSMGQSVKLWAVYWDPNSADAGQLVATWVLDGGTMVSGADPAPSWLSGLLPAFSANAKVAGIAWTAPQEARFCGVTFEAFDPKGLSVIRTVGLPVGAPPPTVNLPPSGYVLGPVRVPAGQQVSFTVIASDPNRDILNFAWSSSGGSFSSPKNDVTTWTAPLSTGFATITCTISDQDSLSFSTQQLVEVVPYVSGTIITDNGKIAGHLIDDYSNLAVDGALVGIVGSETFTVSDSSGYFEISGLTPGAYDLYVQRDGYLVANFYGIVVLK